MNRVSMMGRLTKDPELRYTSGPDATAICRYTLALNRPGAKEGQQRADFINCVTFGKTAEFANKYLQKGHPIIAHGRLQSGSYTNREGQTVYYTEVLVSEHEFCETRSQSSGSAPAPAAAPTDNEGFMQIPDGIDEELPFN